MRKKLWRVLAAALFVCLFAACAQAQTHKKPYLSAERTGKGYTFTFYWSEKPQNAGDIICTSFFENETADLSELYRLYEGKERHFVIDPSFQEYAPVNTAGMFEGADSIEGLEMLSTQNVTNMRGMFRGGKKLTELDCSHFDTRSVTTMQDMFADCILLEKVYIGENWDTQSLLDPEEKVFSKCEALRGQCESTYEGASAAYAVLDGGSAAPGYLSCRHTDTVNEKREILYKGDRYTFRCAVCTLCGMVPKEITIEPTDEKPVEMTIYAFPTCIGTGLCRVGKDEVVLDPLDHDFSQCEIMLEATCLECGHVNGICARCGIHVSVARALGHDWDRINILKPTCTEDGFSYCEICERCLITRNQRPLPALGHDMQPVAEKAATCLEEGWNAHMACTRCDYTEGKIVYPMRSHDMGEWTVTREATCAQEGERQRACRYADCPYTESMPIASPAHKTVYVTDKEATCTTDGKGHEECTVCGKTIGEKVTVKALGHTPGKVEKTEATCTEKGVEKTYCSVCGKCIDTVTISDKLGHEKGEAVVTKAATCTSKGKSEISCKRCGKVLETKTLPLAEHKLSEYTVTKKPTCDEKGTESAECSVCGKKVTRDIAKTQHEWGKWQETKAATANKKGTATRVCSLCGKKDTEKIPKTTSSKYISFMKAHFDDFTPPSEKDTQEGGENG